MKNYHTLNDIEANQLRAAVRAMDRFFAHNVEQLVCEKCKERLEVSGADIVRNTIEFTLRATADAYVDLDRFLEDFAACKEQTDEEKLRSLLATKHKLLSELNETCRDIEALCEDKGLYDLMDQIREE